MGVQTPLSLQEAQTLFPSFNINTLTPTTDGVMDTTYLTEMYVLKHYEREINHKIKTDAKILQTFSHHKLNTPQLLASENGWYLYTRLKGDVPKSISYFHIQALARFLAKMHLLSQKLNAKEVFLQEYNLKKTLTFTQRKYYFYYKKLQSLKYFQVKEDGFIHGDIFKDNTLFDGEKIAVFDFIDGGLGEFSFDIAVALVAFNPHKKTSFTKLFLNTYNQHAPKKVTIKELKKQVKMAAKLYSLLRIQNYKNPAKAKLLSNLW